MKTPAFRMGTGFGNTDEDMGLIQADDDAAADDSNVTQFPGSTPPATGPGSEAQPYEETMEVTAPSEPMMPRLITALVAAGIGYMVAPKAHKTMAAVAAGIGGYLVAPRLAPLYERLLPKG